MPWTGPEMDLCKKVFTADSFLIRNPAEFKSNSFKSPTNLGNLDRSGRVDASWLVLEKWMAPDLFAIVPSADDERSLLAEGGTEAREAVSRFRDTFITQEAQRDLHWLRHEGGIDAVRLPVGFWCLDEFAENTPLMSTQRYVDAVSASKLFDWAEKYGLKVGEKEPTWLDQLAAELRRGADFQSFAMLRTGSAAEEKKDKRENNRIE
eukprot:Skav204864  [mRNA]  locus=scaffold1679:18838:21519:- [translate_table: standard]